MHKAPRCSKGSRRCGVSKTCIRKKSSRSTRKCVKGSRKCANNKCYKKRKSIKTRSRFNRKYGH